MGLTRLAIRRPVTMLMIIGALVLTGLISYTRLPVQQLPNVTFPYVAVIARYPGASPQDVLQTITKPVENALAGVSGIQQMNGISSEGSAIIALQFNVGVDIGTAANDVAQAVNSMQSQLPPGVPAPTIIKANPQAFPILDLVLSGSLRPDQLYQLAHDTLQPALQKVDGVASVEIQGGRVPQVNVTVDPQKLRAYGISLQQVDGAIASQNISVPGGSTTFGGQTSTARTDGYYQSAADLQDLVVETLPSGNVTLGQVSDVVQGSAPVTQQTLYNGRNAVGLSVTAQSGANVVDVERAIKAEMARLAPTLPAGVQTHIVNDSTVFTFQSMRAVEDDLVLAVLLPALILLLFLHRTRNMLIVLLAIPTSMISTFSVMYFLGFNLDLISLLALSLITGILVDDSIVVLENINRHLAMGKGPERAALDGRAEIGLAAVAITLTDVVVYGPIAFTSGIIGEVFREFGLTIVIATLFSLFVSFTLAPLLAARWLRPPEAAAAPGGGGRPGAWARFSAAWERGYDRIRDGYGRVIHAALGRRRYVVLIGIGSLLLSIAFIPLGWVGTSFTPQGDNSQFTVSVRLPLGTPLASTEALVDRLDSRIRAMPGVVDTYLTAGTRAGFFGGTSSNEGQIAVDLRPVGQRPPIDTYLARVRALGRTMPQASIVTEVRSGLGGGGTVQPLSFVLQGPDIHVLDRLAASLAAAMRRLPGVVDVRNEAAQSAPQLTVELDRRQAAHFGITAQTVGDAVQTAIAGTRVSYLRPSGSTDQTPIVVTVAGGDRMTPAQIEQLPLIPPADAPGAGSGSSPPLISVGQVARVVRTTGPEQINDQNGQLQVTVGASTSGVALGTAAAEVRGAIARMGLPPGYSWSPGGDVQQQAQAFGPLFAAFLLSIVLVYMLTSALYESLLYPLAILFSLPLATVGALAALAVSHNTLNLYSFMGLIMLMGLVAKNAILLVDYTNTLRSRGLARTEALVEAGRARLRPILMTTATMVFAMLPLALKIGAGSEDRSPMATVLMGGLITSTMLTLIFVPTVYTHLDDFGEFLVRHGVVRPRRAAGGLAGSGEPWAGQPSGPAAAEGGTPAASRGGK